MKNYNFIFLSLFLTSCWQTESIPTTQEKKITKIGSTFTTELESNPSTGYSWRIAKKPEQIVDVESEYIKPKKVMPGAPGFQQFNFQVSDNQNLINSHGVIELVYERPWEGKAVKRHIINVMLEQ